jgi:hypothetical protein
MKFKVEIIRGVNKGRVLVMDEERAVSFVEENKVRILQVITNDAPPEETPHFISLDTEVTGSIEPHEITPQALGDELDDLERCIALTKSGERCKNARKDDCEHCGTHAPKVIDAQCSIHAQFNSTVKE